MEGNLPHRFGSVSMVTTSLGPNDPKVGDRTRSGDEEYLFVYNTGGEQISPSYGVIVSGVTGYSVSISSVGRADFCVGVCKNATITTGAYGWVVTKGFVDVECGDDAIAKGDLIAISADGTFGKALASGATTTADTVLNAVCGKAMSAIGSGASGPAFINVL